MSRSKAAGCHKPAPHPIVSCHGLSNPSISLLQISPEIRKICCRNGLTALPILPTTKHHKRTFNHRHSTRTNSSTLTTPWNPIVLFTHSYLIGIPHAVVVLTLTNDAQAWQVLNPKLLQRKRLARDGSLIEVYHPHIPVYSMISFSAASHPQAFWLVLYLIYPFNSLSRNIFISGDISPKKFSLACWESQLWDLTQPEDSCHTGRQQSHS